MKAFVDGWTTDEWRGPSRDRLPWGTDVRRESGGGSQLQNRRSCHLGKVAGGSRGRWEEKGERGEWNRGVMMGRGSVSGITRLHKEIKILGSPLNALSGPCQSQHQVKNKSAALSDAFNI
jgi:hypothetical protein